MTGIQREKGFSLVEMMIVVFIAMVLMGFAIPVVISSIRNYNLNSASTNMSRMVQLARYAAIRQGSPACTVLEGTFFGVDTNCSGALDNIEQRFALPVGVTLSAVGPATTTMDFSAAPTVVASPYVITFTARGSSAASPTVSLVYITGWGNTNAVTVTGTGRARSWRYSGSAWH